jgi:predicted AAA+ superfamily ATPase
MQIRELIPTFVSKFNKMVNRAIENLLKEYAGEFRSLLLVGPRQSGKSTLVKKVFPDKPYISLENIDERDLAENDPRAFLGRFPHGAILDEIQRAPGLLNYLQEILDNSTEDGLFILTGSNNLLLQSDISQTLAGRIGILDLLPLSVDEIKSFEPDEFEANSLILKGSYPEIYHKRRNPQHWYPSYIRTYIERDVRNIRNIENISMFIKFLRLCAGRVGQQLNVSSLSNECGIDVKTVNSWLSVLESTYIIKLLQPYYENYNKRVVKTPKLFFYDTGIVCSLLGIRNTKELSVSSFRGKLFENFILKEVMKAIKNNGYQTELYYWKINNGIEIDIIVDNGQSLTPIEIKSAQTYSRDFESNLTVFNALRAESGGMIVYDGNINFKTSGQTDVFNWDKLAEKIKSIL